MIYFQHVICYQDLCVCCNDFWCFSQPDVPYALGGCIVDDTISDSDDLNSLVEGINSGKHCVGFNLITVGLFTVPKNFDEIVTETGVHFDMFTLVLESSDWSKIKMQTAINEAGSNCLKMCTTGCFKVLIFWISVFINK